VRHYHNDFAAPFFNKQSLLSVGLLLTYEKKSVSASLGHALGKLSTLQIIAVAPLLLC
jgi:hypothetical protein